MDQRHDVAVYDIDGFLTSAAEIKQLHDAGRAVICYFSSQYEDKRPDASDFPAADVGRGLDGWEGEKWVNQKSAAIREVMRKRAVLAKSKNCDAVEWDNIDSYSQSYPIGFTIKLTDAVDYVRYLSQVTHDNNMAFFLKNGMGDLASFEPYSDGAVNEQCAEFDECEEYKTVFTSKNKVVFNCEYKSGSYCAKMRTLGIDSIRKTLELTGSAPMDVCATYTSNKGYPYAGSDSTDSADTTVAVTDAAVTTVTVAPIVPSGKTWWRPAPGLRLRYNANKRVFMIRL